MQSLLAHSPARSGENPTPCWNRWLFCGHTSFLVQVQAQQIQTRWGVWPMPGFGPCRLVKTGLAENTGLEQTCHLSSAFSPHLALFIHRCYCAPLLRPKSLWTVGTPLSLMERHTCHCLCWSLPLWQATGWFSFVPLTSRAYLLYGKSRYFYIIRSILGWSKLLSKTILRWRMPQ